MPVLSRASSLASTSRSGMGRAARSTPPKPRATPRASAGGTSSWRVFHFLQAGHCPSHLGETCPHSAQAKTVFCFGASLATRVPTM